MTTQKKRGSKMASGTWGQIFPPNFETQEQSLRFVKKLLAIGISNIMYLRAAFPEGAFDTRNLDGLNLKVLNARSDCTEGRDLCRVVQSATEAIEKGYLRELILAIFLDPEKPEDAVETYTFYFDYTRVVSEAGGDVPGSLQVGMTLGGDSSRLIKDKDDIYKRTVQLIRQTMQLTQSFDSLPEDAYVTVKLTYYDEHTPPDYEPVGFSKNDTEFKCDEEIEPIITSLVETKFHAFKVKIRSREFENRQFSLPCSENLTSQAAPATQNDVTPANLAEIQLECACLTQAALGEDEVFLLCKSCNTKQHGFCFLIFSQAQVPENHLCHMCGAEFDVARSTETKLYKMKQKGRELQPTCLYRRSLVMCAKKHELVASDVQSALGIDAELALQLFDKLVADNVIVLEGTDNMLGRVHLQNLKSDIGPRYLGSKANELLLPCDASKPKIRGLSPVSQLTKETKDMTMDEINKKRPRDDDCIPQDIKKKKKGSMCNEKRLKV